MTEIEDFVDYEDIARMAGLDAAVQVSDTYLAELERRVLEDVTFGIGAEDVADLMEVIDQTVETIFTAFSKIEKGYTGMVTMDVLGWADRLLLQHDKLTCLSSTKLPEGARPPVG